MSKQKTEARVPAKKRTPAKRDSTRRTVSTSSNDNQNQIDNHSDTTPGETPKRKPVTNADAQKKTSNADSDYNEDEEGGDNVRHLPVQAMLMTGTKDRMTLQKGETIPTKPGASNLR